MSFVISVYVPECIVMATDSRQSLKVEWKDPDKKSSPVETVSSDSIQKLFYLKDHQVGIATYGECMPGHRPIGSFLDRFSSEIVEPEDTVSGIAGKLKGFFFSAFPGLDTSFQVAGYEKQAKQRVPHVYHVHARQVKRVNVKEGTEEVVFGCTWGGEADVMRQLLLSPGAPPVLWDSFSPQDAVDFALYSLRTTIDTMRFQARLKTVGGPVDILMLNPKEGFFIQKKSVHAGNPE